MFNPRLIEHNDSYQVEWYENGHTCTSVYPNTEYGRIEAQDFIHTLETVDEDAHLMEFSNPMDEKEENLQ